MQQWEVKEAAETEAIARALAAGLREGGVIAFTGDLGAGKTFMSQCIAAELGVEEAVTSPSFAIIQEYQGVLPVYHFDFYRLGSLAEVLDLGFEDYLEEKAVLLIEWPQIARELLPENCIDVHITFQPDPQEPSELIRSIKILNFQEQINLNVEQS